jgi:hypothetical protein
MIALFALSSVTAFAVDKGKPARRAARKKSRPLPDVNKALATKLPKAVIGGTLSQALEQFGNLIDVPVMADWSGLGGAGVKRTTKVSVRVSKKISAEKLLELILVRVAAKGKPLSWYISNGVLVVATQKRVLGRKTLATVRNIRPPTGKRVTTTTFREHTFKDEPLKNVIETYRQATGVNFHVNWRALQNVGIDREEPITLVVKGVSISRALNMVTDQLSEGKDKFESIYWLINRGVVTITSGHALNAKTIVTIHEVGDLLFAVPNFKGPRLGRSTRGGGDKASDQTGIFDVGAGGGEADGMEKEDAAETRNQAKNSLEKIIRDSIGEEMWVSGGGKGSVRFFRNKMIISQTMLGYQLMKEAQVINAFRQIK